MTLALFSDYLAFSLVGYSDANIWQFLSIKCCPVITQEKSIRNPMNSIPANFLEFPCEDYALSKFQALKKCIYRWGSINTQNIDKIMDGLKCSFRWINWTFENMNNKAC